MEQAIGMPVPSAKGTAPYSRTDLKYDMQTGLIELIPLNGASRGEEHSERQPPTEEQNVGPSSETEVKSVEKGHEHVMHNPNQLDIANAAMLMVEEALEEDDASTACALTVPIWRASASAVGGKIPGAPAEDKPLRKHNRGGVPPSSLRNPWNSTRSARAWSSC